MLHPDKWQADLRQELWEAFGHIKYRGAPMQHDNTKDGWPVSALLKVAFDRAHAANNAYSNKVVKMLKIASSET